MDSKGEAEFEIPESANSELTVPPGWSYIFDQHYQTYYYVHDESGHSQWEYPEQEPLEVFIDTQSTLDFHDSESYKVESNLSKPSKPFPLYQQPPQYSLRMDELEHRPASDTDENNANIYDEMEGLVQEDEESEAEEYKFENLYYIDQTPLNRYIPPYQYDDSHIFEPNVNEKDEGGFSKDHYALEKSSLSYRLNQDYLGLARTYKIQRPYSDPNFRALCVICYKNFSEDVFFPCEHHCVCRNCIRNENICEEQMLGKIPDAYINCSLCAAIIKRIMPLTPDVVEKYWDWVYGDKVQLPKAFLKDFKHSAAVIKTVYMNEIEANNNKEKFCAMN